MLNIVLVDDHVIFRQGLASLLKSIKDIRVSGESSGGSSAVDMVERLMPDVTILDISMPGLDGFQIMEELNRRKVSTKFILLSMLNDPATIAKSIKMDIAGFVPKDNVFEDLVYAIRAVASGQQFISPSVTKALHDHLANRENAMVKLSTREKEVLRLVAEGLTSRQIAERLFISPNTVENHRERIMQKLDIHKNVDLVKYAIANNLLN